MRNTFPKHKQHTFFIPGPCGQIEALSTWPQSLSPDDNPAAQTNSSTTSDPSAAQLHLTQASPITRIALICHPHPLFQGSMHNKVVTTLAKAYASLGIATLRFNFRGVGKSEGDYGHIDGEVEDAIAVMQYINKTLPQHVLHLAGFSFGSYVAAQVASQFPCQSLISVAPPVTHMPFDQLAKINCPWLVLMGDKDKVITVSEVEKWHQTHKLKHAPEPFNLTIIPTAGHFFHGLLPNLKQLAVDFIKKSLPHVK